ncbi:hypothetical protein [Paracraurococcus lichenis]|uniref:XRE family transcriptional regulator n=1 Tax=Paracraurococcus lichenis TaxID=3064888 RepID=A0ABT9E8H0_9PROT|nr:hypothetical protein [Paracraurococcus sp. LOR1-02]MDO9712474.1 hypothetical protein [Paracraurococcus sp. LOR1-02]
MGDFAALLAEAGVSRPWLAARTGRTRGAVDRWCDGSAEPPAEVMDWLRRRLADLPPVLARYTPTPPARRALKAAAE